MGIVEAISRVKEGVRRAGLEAVLRADKIPAPLRPTAQRLADLLTPAVSKPEVVSLEHAILAHEAHAAASPEQMAAAGGVCPFSGMNASMASLFEAPGLEVVHTSDALFEPEPDARAESSLQQPVDAELVPAQAPEIVPEPAPRAQPKRAPAARPKKAAAAAPAVAAPEKSKAGEKKPATKVAAKPTAKPVAQPAPVAAKKKAQPRAEKGVEKVAAKAPSSKTPARSTVVATARPAAQRPTAKAAKK